MHGVAVDVLKSDKAGHHADNMIDDYEDGDDSLSLYIFILPSYAVIRALVEERLVPFLDLLHRLILVLRIC